MTEAKTKRLLTENGGIATAAQLLQAGTLVAIPTETVYGLAADATNGHAVAQIFAAKGRPTFNPLICHVESTGQAESLAQFSPLARALAEVFWPGPLTLVLPRRADSGLSELISAGLPSVALRAPAHPVARALIAKLGRPLAAPSANLSGTISPTTAAHVLKGLSGRIAAVLDTGPCDIGVESTIVGLTDNTPRLLRPGGIAAEALEAVLGRSLAAPEGSTLTAPGMMTSHYAPAAGMRLNATDIRPGEVKLGFGPGPADLNLSPKGDLAEAAANLFAHLHALDAKGAQTIAIAPIPQHGLGAAINDRLRRAAAPRD